MRRSGELFYIPEIESDSMELVLSADESYHASKVLRLKKGDKISVTDGKGLIALSEIKEVDKSKTVIRVIEKEIADPPQMRIHLAISPLKKRSKMELLVEKLTELGVSEISFVNCHQTERTKLNKDRLMKIAVSAVKQSINPFLPIINTEVSISEFLDQVKLSDTKKLIAYCKASESEHLAKVYGYGDSVTLLIGPEGDFTEEEVWSAESSGFNQVSLGKTRLRSETAALYAVIATQSINDKHS